MPELRQARQLMSSARREVIVRIKAVHAAELALGLARHSKDRAESAKAAKLKAALTTATRLLKSANNFEVQASRKLAKVIASETAKLSADTRARTLARYQEKQEQKAETDLQKAVARFIAAWNKQRAKIDARKLAVVTRKAAVHAAKARKQANAKARAAVEKAAAVSKAGARKAADKVRAKAARLKVRIGR